jgi:hypothetical protein
LSILPNWNIISAEEASVLLFERCVELMLNESSYLITADVNIRILTQRLYGDYRQIKHTQEYKRAEKHVNFFKNTGLGKELF